MPEIDRSASQPALPILGSVLLQNELKARRRFASQGARISTGCGEIDDHVLGGGGFERGIVVGVNGEDTAGRLIAYHAIASVVMSHLEQEGTTSRKALVIDVSGNFSVQLLSDIIRYRLRHATALKGVKRPNFIVPGSKIDDDLEAKVMQCLQMVDIDTVFDIMGLWEVLGGGGSERTLFESNTEILFVDNMGVLITSLLSSGKSEAYDLLATLARTLVRLSHDFNILIILRTVASPNTVQPDKTSMAHLNSLFTDNSVKPALGRMFDQFTDLHLLIGNVPDTSSAKIYVVEVLKDETPNLEADQSVKPENVVGAREQRWAPVVVDSNMLRFSPAYIEKGARTGLRLEMGWHTKHK
ncbi:hypothetical protein B0O99DRAFT_702631 [Bisporella sp. PMI_857]|nr:hypothetical protein B0O99DRAFT_702631 [Bisporella sp. PMI_857]